MELTQEDLNETKHLAMLNEKIDRIDAEYVNSVSDEIYMQQPFFLSVLLGYSQDVSMTELEELMKIYFLIWEYFKANNKIPRKKVTQDNFEKIQARNANMLKYIEGELNQTEKHNIYSYDLGNLKSKSLLTAIFYRYQSRPVLINMDKKMKAIILIGIKSFIELFESNIR